MPSIFRAEPLRTLAYGSITGGYVAIGGAMLHPIQILEVTNNTDVILTFSYDGINPHFVLLAGTARVLDITSDSLVGTGGDGLYLATGSTIYVTLNGTPSTGSVYVSASYGGAS